MSGEERLFALASEIRAARGETILYAPRELEQALVARAPDLAHEARALADALIADAAARIDAAEDQPAEAGRIAAEIAGRAAIPLDAARVGVTVAHWLAATPAPTGETWNDAAPAELAPVAELAPTTSGLSTNAKYGLGAVAAVAALVFLSSGHIARKPAAGGDIPISAAGPREPLAAYPQPQDPDAVSPPIPGEEDKAPMLTAFDQGEVPPSLRLWSAKGVATIYFSINVSNQPASGQLQFAPAGWNTPADIQISAAKGQAVSHGRLTLQPTAQAVQPMRVGTVQWDADALQLGTQCAGVFGLGTGDVAPPGAQFCFTDCGSGDRTLCGTIVYFPTGQS